MKSTEYYVVVAKAGGVRRICIEKKNNDKIGLWMIEDV